MDTIPQKFTAKYWHLLENGKIQCDLCPQACQLLADQHGICFVRKREAENLIALTYGMASGFAIDPIEKKPLHHFLPGSKALSFGTIGCNLSCKFCQNWDISRAKDLNLLREKISPRQIAENAKKMGAASVAFTYNEPIISFEYTIDTAKECQKLGIKTIAVTNGYICEKPREEFFSVMDAANVDLKGFTEDFYRQITGAALQPVLDTLVYLKKHTKVWLEITTLLIPGKNDSSEEIEKETAWLAKNVGVEVPLHFSAFFPAYKMLDVLPTPLNTLLNAREIALKNGLRYVYAGNLPTAEASTTYCHHCKKALISRLGYQIDKYELDLQGRCKFCQTPCAGVFV
jgi:pyruvate formate lyase activating enzyme